MLNKLFGKKKKEKYFLEFDVKTEPKTQVEKPVETKTSPETNETEVTTPAPKPKAKTSATSAPKATVSYDSPEWVKAIKNYSNQGNGQSAEGVNANTFAGKYVTNNVSMSRRRPGASLKMFKDMASQINK